ncbi:hypothetical protein CONLIGDRAFT_716048 [Coniochaeta ligniaria NRRL 30616]|uniref:Uncharacterized protein n=1 Tax=Coniochaeta ligniaria NRRL 30616 TaxID=1408157 RepID=A0A1J7IIR3_9PEZI|nr:hypothetical protein CONLIGDRAFT_716048 [Coniochaeta ligniaria NRRL 30616]
MNPFSTDQRIRKLESQLGKCQDREAEVVYRIKRYIEGFKRKYHDKKNPIDQIIDLCDGLWTAQDTSSKLAESHRIEWAKSSDHVRALGNALNVKDTEVIDAKAALRDKEQEARIKLREHKDAVRKHEEETRNFLHTISQLNDQINEIKLRNEGELRRIRDEHIGALDAVNGQHRYAFEKQQTDHAWTVQNQRDQYEQEMINQRNAYEQELQRKEIECAQRIASLEADLLSNSDDFRPATDDVLKVKYRKLKLLIDTITDPFNLGASGVTHLSNRLDPTSFLPREGNKFLRFLLRSVIWGIVMDGFFSMPFGFGALGPDTGRQQLLDVYRAWQRLYAPDNESVSPFYTQGELEIFQRDKEANKWRSATFQSIMAAVMPKASSGGRQAYQTQAAAMALGTTYAQNCARVERDILGVLNEVANGVVHSELQDSVPEIARLAGELALEFGSQRSQLGLALPVRGDNIQIGEQFVDCIDGEGGKGSYVAVELVVCPSMFRVGDGRADLQSRRAIFPGEIYPMRNQLP